eukprot:3625090-Rhodomonas_salina.1
MKEKGASPQFQVSRATLQRWPKITDESGVNGDLCPWAVATLQDQSLKQRSSRHNHGGEHPRQLPCQNPLGR